MRGIEGWQDLGFKDLLVELKKWTDINLLEESITEKSPQNGDPPLKPPCLL